MYSNAIFIFIYSVFGIFIFIYLYKNLIKYFEKSKNHIRHGLKINILYLLLLMLTWLSSLKAASAIFPILDEKGIQYKLFAGMIILLIIVLNTIWTIINLYIINKLPQYTGYIKSIILGLCFISLIVITSVLIYGNIYQDFNYYYMDRDPLHHHGIFKGNERVFGITNLVYFSSIVIFTIGIDDVSIIGADLKWIVMSEMFLSYLLMSIFVPCLLVLLDPKDIKQKKKNKKNKKS